MVSTYLEAQKSGKASLPVDLIYSTYFGKNKKELAKSIIARSIRRLDRSVGAQHQSDEIENMAQEFFTWILEKNILESYDSQRANSKDPIYTFLFNHLRNFYQSNKRKEDNYNKMKNEMYNLGQTEIAIKNKVFRKSDGSMSNGTIISNKIKNEEEDRAFCHDIKKLSKKFIRTLKGKLEKDAYKLFIYDEASHSFVAKILGISERTSYRLKDAIFRKAKKYLNNYYIGKYNYN